MEFRSGRFHGRALYSATWIDAADAISRELSGSDETVVVPEHQRGFYVEGAYDIGPWVNLREDKSLRAWVRYENLALHDQVPAPFSPDPELDFELWSFGLELLPHPSVVVKADVTLQDPGAGGDTNDPFRLGAGLIFQRMNRVPRESVFAGI